MTAIADYKSGAQPVHCRDRLFQLGDWRVDPMRNLLERHDGVQRQLEPRLMHLLCLLAEATGQVLTRETLVQALWPDVIVTENSLTRAISDLRLSLVGPDESRSALIETVPKRGYRLGILPVSINDKLAARENRLLGWFTRGPRLWAPTLVASMVLLISLLIQWPASSDARTDSSFASTTLAQKSHWQDAVVNVATELPVVPIRLTSIHETSVLPGVQGLRDLAPELLAGAVRSLITPDGSLIAYTEQKDGISKLSLWAIRSGEEPWTAFVTEEHISDLQWSPLDAGLLFTVGVTAQRADQPHFIRLMLLDLENLELHELHRRELPHHYHKNDERPAGGGSLT